MAQMSNCEPRRFWHQPKQSSSWKKLAREWGSPQISWKTPKPKQRKRNLGSKEARLHCTSCGTVESVSSETVIPFCLECLERSKQANIDEWFDDLRIAG